MVGVAGFIVDASTLYMGIALGLGLYFSRVVSYTTAVTATWLLNRQITFRDSSSPALMAEWARFAVSQLGGATVNVGAYYVLVRTSALVAAYPVIGVAVGSLSGLFINYVVARLFVFRRKV